MKIINIKDKLKELDVDYQDLILGDFDAIGEYTAKRERNTNDPNYKWGKFYRSNYERGILLYYLIRKFNISSVLEIGLGRAYSSVIASKAFYDGGINGKIVSIEPNLNEKFINFLAQVFPQDWIKNIEIRKGTSQEVLPKIQDQKFDLVLIDGDHTFEGVKYDWENVQNLFTKFCLFDDYHLPSKVDEGIQVRTLVDQVDENLFDCKEKELILMDREIFSSDKPKDKVLDYGQVLLTKNIVLTNGDW